MRVEGVPDLFGEEGHEGTEEAQCGFEDGDERVSRVSCGGGVAGPRRSRGGA